VATDGYTSELAREVAPDVLERFLRYVRIDTQSDENVTDRFPSTAKQLDLSRLLVEELRALGIEDAELSDDGYVYATVPATVDGVPTIGFVAHVDTSPDANGTNVQPIVHRDFDGEDLALPGDPSQVLSSTEFPELREHTGHDIVTSDGTTLLGADDKAGVAEIMAAAAYLVRHPELRHGRIRLGFTPDEEVGRGAARFDIERFGAEAAYTLDGSTAGEIEDETFSAFEATMTFRGVNAHPGTAKGILVNAAKLAAEVVARLPEDSFSPETTEGREGFVHPKQISGQVGEASVVFIVRDHDWDKLQSHLEYLRRLGEEVAAEDPRARVSFEAREQYRNMKEYLGDNSPVVERAARAIERAGLAPIRSIIRGGTDGSILTERGLPTPNLFTGGHGYHGEREWACVQDMAAAVETIVQLAQIWAEDAGAA
jgi:tripeptide aminopeptidase